jgi:hypothetical protein
MTSTVGVRSCPSSYLGEEQNVPTTCQMIPAIMRFVPISLIFSSEPAVPASAPPALCIPREEMSHVMKM